MRDQAGGDRKMRDYAKSIRPLLNSAADCPCGQHHEVALKKVVIEAGALTQVAGYLREQNIGHAAVVGDARTLAAAGGRLAGLLHENGIATAVCRIDDNDQGEVIADEQAIVQLL